MATSQTRPFQFGLKSLFGLMTAVGLCLWLVPAAARTLIPAAPYYVLVGVAQLSCGGIVYQQLRARRHLRVQPSEEPYELALLGMLVTLWTWLLTLLWVVGDLVGVTDYWAPSIMFTAALIGAILHLPTLCLQVLGLFVTGDWRRHWSLATLFLLNIANSLMVFGMLAVGIGKATIGIRVPG